MKTSSILIGLAIAGAAFLVVKQVKASPKPAGTPTPVNPASTSSVAVSPAHYLIDQTQIQPVGAPSAPVSPGTPESYAPDWTFSSFF